VLLSMYLSFLGHIFFSQKKGALLLLFF